MAAEAGASADTGGPATAPGDGVNDTLLAAVALMLVLEGVLPFLMPSVWRDTFRRLVDLSDGQLRFIGLTAMLAGVLLLFMAHSN